MTGGTLTRNYQGCLYLSPVGRPSHWPCPDVEPRLIVGSLDLSESIVRKDIHRHTDGVVRMFVFSSCLVL